LSTKGSGLPGLFILGAGRLALQNVGDESDDFVGHAALDQDELNIFTSRTDLKYTTSPAINLGYHQFISLRMLPHLQDLPDHNIIWNTPRYHLFYLTDLVG
jgi:hypothetical protein